MHTAGIAKIIPQDGPAKPPPLAAGALHCSRQTPRGGSSDRAWQSLI